VRIYECVYVCVCVCVYTHTHTHTHIHIEIQSKNITKRLVIKIMCVRVDEYEKIHMYTYV